jgi:Cd2+/Zn2+-exporting ATPase/Cu+-exporting ATPase
MEHVQREKPLTQNQTLVVPIAGMDCADCTRHVQHAIAGVEGVESVDVYLGSEKAIVQLDPTLVDLSAIRRAVQDAGYSVPDAEAPPPPPSIGNYATRAAALLAIVFGVVLFVVVVGEWLGLFERLTERVPWYLGVLIVLAGGWPMFVKVVRAALKGQVLSHTLMVLGVLAALAVGQWATAAVVVLFMHVGDTVERLTSEGARGAVKDLTAMAPQTARLEREGVEQEVPIAEVRAGDVVVVRPGESIPVDGEVVSGQAAVDSAALTGESMPVEAGPGTSVLAATIVQGGSLRVRTARVGEDTTFGRVIKLVEEAEANRADVQRFADKFSAYYLPVVLGLAALTYLLRGDPMATAAVLVVVCSCSIALATPIAMLASVGSAAKRGLLIKGGKYLEALDRADVLLIDKTGTLTLGRPQITDVIPLAGLAPTRVLALAATAERYSEHPLAEAVRAAAREREIALGEPEAFRALPGLGVEAQVDGRRVTVGSSRLLGERATPSIARDIARELEAQGKTLLYLVLDDEAAGVLAAADTLRGEVPAALDALRALGVSRIELLTGDNERAAASLAEKLGVSYRAELLPEDKIAAVQAYQAQGHTVVMVGDGVNDAPALAQADVGVAMGAAGTDVAIEAAHVALMRDDWTLVPELFHIARRTMRVVKMNLGFTAAYNVVGLTLAAFGILPPILAAAAQSLPDLLILANSSRLLRTGDTHQSD